MHTFWLLLYKLFLCLSKDSLTSASPYDYSATGSNTLKMNLQIYSNIFRVKISL